MDVFINGPFNTNKLYKLKYLEIKMNQKRDFKCVKTVE